MIMLYSGWALKKDFNRNYFTKKETAGKGSLFWMIFKKLYYCPTTSFFVTMPVLNCIFTR